jgi:hypothetical protein
MPSTLKEFQNQFNLGESKLKVIQDKRQSLIKNDKELQSLYKVYKDLQNQKRTDYEIRAKEPGFDRSSFMESPEYKKITDKMDNAGTASNNRRREITKPFDLKYKNETERYGKIINDNQKNFLDSKLNPITRRMDSTFYKEAENLKKVYGKLHPNSNVDIVPIYDNPDLIRDKVSGLNPNDSMYFFGHSGDRLGGIPNQEVATILADSEAENCYLGSCGFEGQIEPFQKALQGKNLQYRPEGSWWGVNPGGSSIEDAMWSRVDKNKNSSAPGSLSSMKNGAKIIKPTLGKDYNQLQRGGEQFKAQYGREQATMSSYEEPAWYEKALDRLASPMTAFGYSARNQDVPDNLPINMEKRNAFDSIIDTVNPFAWIKYGAQANRDLDKGDYLDAGLSALGAIPIVPAWLSQSKKLPLGALKKGLKKTIAKKVIPKADGITNFAKGILKDAKPNANNLSNITEVNPLTQAQALNLSRRGDSGVRQVLNEFEEGANTIDDFTTSYLKDLLSPEGYKRLVTQEADHLSSIGFDPKRIAQQSEINAGARLNEIATNVNVNRLRSNIGKNLDEAVTNKEITNVVGNNKNFTNASYTPPNAGDLIDDLVPPTSPAFKGFNIEKPVYVGGKIGQGEVRLGTAWQSNPAIAAHEAAGHALQRGRVLPVDNRLRALTPEKNLNPNAKAAYDYFRKGSNNREPSAFLHELRQAMLDAKLIKNRYDDISPSKLKMAKIFFNKRPAGVVNKGTDSFLSNTRILDFMGDTADNFNLLSKELNNLPVAIPAAIGLGTAGALSQQQDGGEIENNIMYKNYIDGVYTGSKMESKAEKIYDKLNRLHYRDAKARQMTPANYVLTHVIG